MRYFRRNPFNVPDEVFTVLDDDDTCSGVDGSKVLVIYDKEALIALDEDFDPDQDKGIRNIIRAGDVLEKHGLVQIISIKDLLRTYGINLPDDDDTEDFVG